MIEADRLQLARYQETHADGAIDEATAKIELVDGERSWSITVERDDDVALVLDADLVGDGLFTELLCEAVGVELSNAHTTPYSSH